MALAQTPPASNDLELTCDEDAVAQSAVSFTATNGKAVRLAVKTKPRHGAVTLDAGTVAYVPAKNFNGDDTFVLEAGGPMRVLVHVTPLNDAPTVAALSLSTAEDTAVTGSLVGSDVDGEPLSYQVKDAASHGEAVVDSKAGTVTYTPSIDFNGVDGFTVEVSDGLLTAVGQVKVIIAAVNDGPVVKPATFSVDEDGKLEGRLEATDVENAALTFRVATKPKHAELSLTAAGAFTYIPARDFHGDDSFSFDVSDGQLTTRGTAEVTVATVNDAPLASSVAVTTNEDTAVSGFISASDVDQDTLTYRVATAPAHGDASVDVKTGKWVYTPAPNFNGPDSFTIEVSDGSLSAQAAVKVSVVAVNDAPVARAGSFSTNEDVLIEGQLEATDVDETTLTYRVLLKPKHGEVTLSPNGAFTFAPTRDFFGADEFSYEVSDGRLTARAVVVVAIASVNDAPVLKVLSLSTPEDTVVKGVMLGSDVDADALTYAIKTAAGHGDAVIDPKNGQLSYRPALNFNGADAFVVEVTDGQVSAQADVKVSVAAVNDAPVAQSGHSSVNEDAKLEGTVQVSDVEHDPLTIRIVAKTKHGELALHPQTGAFTYMPVRDFRGADSFTFEVTDNALKSSVATMVIDVVSVNDAPVTRPLSLTTAEDAAVRGAVVASDVDGDVLSHRVGTPPSHGTATVDPKTGNFAYVPDSDFNGSDAFTIDVNDGSATTPCAVSVLVAPVGDAPRIAAVTFETPEDTAAEGRLPGSDPDGDRLTFHLLSKPKLGDAVLLDARQGTWRLTPNHDVNGDDEITFDVSDGTTTVKGAMKIRVTAVNDAPTLANLSLTTQEDIAQESQLSAADVDGDALRYTLVDPPQFGRAIVDAASGRVRFEPPRDQHGQTSFTVAVSDGTLKSEPATVQVEVTAVNDAPLALSADLTDDEDVELRGTLKATDVDGDALTFSIARGPLHGAVVLVDAAAGTFVYTPAANYSGPDEFRFSATDQASASSTAAVKISVRPVNDRPVAMPDNLTAPASGSVTGRLRGYDRESPRVTFRIVEQPSSGKVKLLDARTGDFVFVTEGVSERQVAFRFVADDGALTSEPAQITVDIRSHSF